MVTKTLQHALAAFVILANEHSDEFLGARQIAEQIDAPANYLGKLLQDFAQRGLLESRKGPNGGFRLARSAESISLFEIAEPIENLESYNRCFMGRKVCSSTNPCPVHYHWHGIRNAFIGFLKGTSLRDASAGDTQDLRRLVPQVTQLKA